MTDIIEGTWDEVQAALAKRQLEGHSSRLRVTVEDLPDGKTSLPSLPTHFASKEEAEKWVADLRAWAKTLTPLNHPIDDSRDTIYNEVVRDPR